MNDPKPDAAARPSSPLQRALDEVRRDPWAALARVIAVVAVLLPVAIVIAPWFRDIRTFGHHDWDVMTAHRELVRLSLLRYHEFPSWNPYACGGFPAWGYVEADTIIVSPFLPLYLALPMALALRLEVLGMALVGVAGAYLAASRFTASRAARALVCVLWAVDGRWALQAAAGHMWHLAYAWLPWCLYFFERARAPRWPEDDGGCRPQTPGPASRLPELAGLGASIAMIVYGGGIYPLPHMVLTLGVYALVLAVYGRSLRPLILLAEGGLLGVGLSAPKLLPLIDGVRKIPRLTESKETIDLGTFYTMLTSHDQGFLSKPARVPDYFWHEWGIYVSLAGVLAMALGVVLVQGRREAALKAAGVFLGVLGFGAFHADAPWPLLHRYLPVFKSQHVPSRFFYPAVLVLGIVAAAGLGRLISRRPPWVDALAASLVLLLGVDIAKVARQPMAETMWMVPQAGIPTDAAFHFEQDSPFKYEGFDRTRLDKGGSMYLPMLGNTGVINCYGTPPFDPKGARAVTDPKYRGEAFVEGRGSAKIAEWSPNHAVIDVTGADPGAIVVYNMNFEEGWSAEGAKLESRGNAVAGRLAAGGDARITFRYRPNLFRPGLAIGFGTIAALAYFLRRERRERLAGA